MPRTILLLPLLFLGLLLSACGSSGGGAGGDGPIALGEPPTATFVVTNHDDDGPGSLRQAIADAPPGAWIVFDDALPAGDITLASPLVVEKVLTIGGLDSMGDRHGIDGQGLRRIFHVQFGALQLNDLELFNGNESEGGALFAQMAPIVLWRCHIHHCHADVAGGGVFVDHGSLEVFDCFFETNDANGAAGALVTLFSPTRIERTSFYDSLAGTAGALYARGATLTMVNCALHENEAASGPGGAIFAMANAGAADTAIALYNVTMSENTSAVSGGGLHLQSEDGETATLLMHRTIVALNSAAASADISSQGPVAPGGTYNMIGIGSGLYFHALDNNSVGDGFSPFDPELLVPSPLPDGRIVSLPLPLGPCIDAVPAGMNLNPEGEPMLVDLRFLPRFPAQPSDIGCIEL